MPEVVKTVINDIEFSVELMHTSIAGDVFGRLQGIIATVLGPHTEYKLGQTDTWIMESIAGYLTYYSQHIDILDISKKILWNTDIVYVGGGKAGTGHLSFIPSTPEKVNKDPFCFDNFFAGKLDLLFELLLFAVGANYPSFFGKISSAIEMIKIMSSQDQAEEMQLEEGKDK